MLTCGDVYAFDVILSSFVCYPLLSWCMLYFTNCVLPRVCVLGQCLHSSLPLSGLLFVCHSAYILCQLYWLMPLSRH